MSFERLVQFRCLGKDSARRVRLLQQPSHCTRAVAAAAAFRTATRTTAVTAAVNHAAQHVAEGLQGTSRVEESRDGEEWLGRVEGELQGGARGQAHLLSAEAGSRRENNKKSRQQKG
jgi:hypothetical protein